MKEMTINEITQIMFKWLDMKLKSYDKLEYSSSIYLYYTGNISAEIRINMVTGIILYDEDIFQEFCGIIETNRNDFENFLTNWVEDTFNLKNYSSYGLVFGKWSELKIPK